MIREQNTIVIEHGIRLCELRSISFDVRVFFNGVI